MEQLLAELDRLGIRLKLEGDDLRVSARAGALDERLRQALRAHKPSLIRSLRASAQPDGALQPITHDAATRFDPFPLTELQHAYWLGRDSALEMGSVATHLYVELACRAFDLPRANRALCELIRRHDMLRAVVDGEGRQRVLASVPDYTIAEAHGHHDAAAGEAAVQATRSVLSHQVLRADQWPLFDIRATHLPGGEVRLHVSLDLLILDAWSIFLFFREWHALYLDPNAGVRPQIGYRDYVLAERSRRDGPDHAAAQAYWNARIDALPPAPALPLRTDPAARRAPRFSRRETRLAEPRWNRLKQHARDRGLTPSGVILGAYAEVLARWSAHAHFTLNITTGSRQPWHPEVHQLLGDFTSLVLHEVDRRDANASFAGFAARQQDRLLKDLDHGTYSGLIVRREWARRRGITLQAALPVVFSSGLVWGGDDEVGNLEQFGTKVHSISQTSQVWLDHHVMELDGELVLIWDAVDAVFEPGVLDAMFEAYTALIDRLADDPAVWEQADVVALPCAMQARRVAANDTAAPLPAAALHGALVAVAQARPEALALIGVDRSLSYGTWLSEACALADVLLDAGVELGEPVAVVMHKGWEQPVAVLAALLAGGAYVPIDADLPVRRQAELLSLCGARRVLTQPHAWRVDSSQLASEPPQVLHVRAGSTAVFGKRHARSLVSAGERLAYIIFTSGTTGVPKGVMVEHGAAVNTVHAVNRLFGVGPADRTLGVSSLSFDLSVYDIFGVPGAGGALVLPDARAGHDAGHWLDCLRAHALTIWNSAPQLMRMLLDTLPPGEATLASLSTVLLSGDFIPLDLPARMRAHGFRGRFVSLGGATEAAIWSIYHQVGEVDPAWPSIPYGRALPNQALWVLDAALRTTPDHVRGRIYIGGRGLARGYLGDPDKTAQRFIVHPRSGERLYDTGDLGRCDRQGDIVILGRDDGQIKVRGHRVELGEIEAVLRRHPGVDQAVVLAPPGVDGAPALVAYVVPCAATPAPSPDVAALRLHIAESLPDYMVPRQLVMLASLPLSANGKVDVAALPVLLPGAQDAPDKVAPRDAVEATVLAAWSSVIPGLDIGVTDNFFDLGGDSVLATQLLRELNATLPLTLEMHELFENLTIEALANLVKARQDAPPACDTGVAQSTRGLAATETLLADVALGRSAVQAIVAAPFTAPPPAATGSPRQVLLSGATGWVGVHVLAALLKRSDCDVVCLVRGGNAAEARARLLERLADVCGLHGPVLSRVHVACGDITQPRLGLDETLWSAMANGIDAVFHLAATVGVLHDYASHRRSNVEPLHELLHLVAQGRRKPLHTLAPMAVCRRWPVGERSLQVDTAEQVGASPDGLLTPYAQSKWVAEQVLWSAAEAGLPVRLYRCSHALPSSDRGRGKPGDTYGTVLMLASHVAALPDWPEARLHGLPVNHLAETMVGDAFAAGNDSAVVHLEQSEAPAFCDVLATLLRGHGSAVDLPVVAPEQWRHACLDAAAGLPPALQALASALFERRGDRWAVENMFSAHSVETTALSRHMGGAPMHGLTPPDYWLRAFAPAPEDAARPAASAGTCRSAAATS